MSLTSSFRPASFSFSTSSPTNPSTSTAGNGPSKPFKHETNYLTLSRMLIRFEHLILLTPVPDSEQISDLSPVQKQTQAELWSPLPFHRTKWLRNIESARTLLLQLERSAQGIKVQRVKKDVAKDLADKRTTIKRLRNRIDEISREVDAMGENAWKLPDDESIGDTLAEILAEKETIARQGVATKPSKGDLTGSKPITDISEQKGSNNFIGDDEVDEYKTNTSTSPNIRRRAGQKSDGNESKAKATGFSNMVSTERALLDSSRTHEDLTADLVSMAAQLKQQARAFQFSLDQDKGLLGRALEGLDRNISGMEAAGKNMAFLKRMSEGEGWFGRMKLYALIFGMWILAILLVFVGPKLRF